MTKTRHYGWPAVRDGTGSRRRGRLEGCKEISYPTEMITSKLTSKAQTTVPQAVRTALGLKVGDEIAYVIEQGRVVLTRRSVTPECDDPFATFSEWESAQDAQAYAGF